MHLRHLDVIAFHRQVIEQAGFAVLIAYSALQQFNLALGKALRGLFSGFLGGFVGITNVVSAEIGNTIAWLRSIEPLKKIILGNRSLL